MTALEQKRQQYVTQLQQLKNSKLAEVNRKVEEYRRQLTTQMNVQIAGEEQKITAVISALDKVIEFEKTAQ